jgi:hypothetical protein
MVYIKIDQWGSALIYRDEGPSASTFTLRQYLLADCDMRQSGGDVRTSLDIVPSLPVFNN